MIKKILKRETYGALHAARDSKLQYILKKHIFKQSNWFFSSRRIELSSTGSHTSTSSPKWSPLFRIYNFDKNSKAYLSVFIKKWNKEAKCWNIIQGAVEDICRSLTRRQHPDHSLATLLKCLFLGEAVAFGRHLEKYPGKKMFGYPVEVERRTRVEFHFVVINQFEQRGGQIFHSRCAIMNAIVM